MSDALDQFSPPTRAWFRERLGAPTPPQVQGWPAIQRGEHTLILAPTGSGKTLAAFLWSIDQLYREPRESAAKPGIRLLYISPLKALNNDVDRNLQTPLDGIRAAAERMGQPLPALRTAVRTGDTPAAARAAMLKTPPHILITTPESLYLMLTSPRARELFRSVRAVIVDEIHTLCGNKRGAHLTLSLERLAHLADGEVQRIGLSATVKPLEEAARFLGGSRPVSIIDAQYPKALDLQVVTAVKDFRELPGQSIWPAVIPQVLGDMYRHRTTLIFANNRRLAERTADRLNAQLEAVRNEEIEPTSTAALAPGGLMRDRGMFAIGAEGPIRAHHGSMSKEARLSMEDDLKAGRLPALVGTSSLELGIDIGSVDLVVQLQSPKSVSQGLQRVGRSGHLVGQTSRGRIYATFREDLLEAAAIAKGMLERDVEPTSAPQNALDVLAQQIVAMVAVEDWSAGALFELVQRAWPYHALPRTAFDAVLEMLSGKYAIDADSVRAASSLRAKIAWDRVNDRLTALPGTRMAAISNPGTIPDTGAYGAYLSDGKTKIGELDEEFVFETRVGDTFLLGSKVWRVAEIKDDRIVVADAAGATPRMPFWNGDYPYRPYDLGLRIGRFRREIAERIASDVTDAELTAWLQREYVLDDNSAVNLIEHVRQQLDALGAMSSDRTIIVESFQNDVGDPHMVVHTPFGGRVNGAWALALSHALRERTGVPPEMQANDDGIIFRFTSMSGEPMLELVRSMSTAEARERILHELPGSAAFGAQFRMNASRALLISKPRGVKRVPFWLQRMKAKDLLAVVGKFNEFPIVVETYRDCLRDVFDLPHLEDVLNGIHSGDIRVVPVESLSPSPIAAALLFNFTGQYLYEWDAPKAERQLQTLTVPRVVLAELLKDTPLNELLRPEAVADVQARAQHNTPEFRSRMIEELALLLRELGDLSTEEIVERCAGDGRAWIAALAEQGRAVEIALGAAPRWVPVELAEAYRAPGEDVLRRFLRHSGPVTRADLLKRYAFDAAWLDGQLNEWVQTGTLVRGKLSVGGDEMVCDAEVFAQMHRRTLTILRKEIQPVALPEFTAFLTRWQHAHPETRWRGADATRRAVEQLRGMALPLGIWERDVLGARVVGQTDGLDGLGGDLVWAGAGGGDLRRAPIRLFFRGEGALFLGEPDDAALSALSPQARAVRDFLKAEGASLAADLQAGLGLTPAALSAALAELSMAGMVTHDAIDALRQMIEADGAAPREGADRKPISALEADLAARLGERNAPAASRPGFGRAGRMVESSRYRDAKRRVNERLRSETQLQRAVQPAGAMNGRWSLLHRAGVLGPPAPAEARADQLLRLLLARYGVLTRNCLQREALPFDWSQLYPLLDRMEMRGEVRRGYFVTGLAGLQFALPEAVERLRAPGRSDDAVVLLSALDPTLLTGLDAPDALQIARLPSTHVALLAGRAIVIFEDSGARITASTAAPRDAIQRAIAAYPLRPGAPRRIVVTHWNGAEVLGSVGQALLKACGFSPSLQGMEYWSS